MKNTESPSRVTVFAPPEMSPCTARAADSALPYSKVLTREMVRPHAAALRETACMYPFAYSSATLIAEKCSQPVDASWTCRGRVVGMSASVPRGGGGAGRMEAEECVVSGGIEQEMSRHTHVAEDGHHRGRADAVAWVGPRKQRE